MAWTSPKTFVAAEVLTASEMNTYVRDNTLYLKDIVGDWQSWTPTFTGFSVNPSNFSARYLRIGGLCIATFRAATDGISNATSFEMTAPVAAATVSNAIWTAPLALYIDNGTATRGAGYLQIASAGTSFSLYTSAGNWTNSGAKSARFQIIYEVT